MDKLHAAMLCEALGTQPTGEQKRQGWLVAPCPLAPWLHTGGVDRHPSFAISDKPGQRSRYNCFSCGAHGTLSDLVHAVHAHAAEGVHVGLDFPKAFDLIANEQDPSQITYPDDAWKAKPDPKPETVIWPDVWMEAWEPLDGEAINYLVSRMFVPKDWAKVELRYDSQRKRILFVIRNWKGQLCGCHSRTIVAGVKPPYLGYKYDPEDPGNPFSENGIWNSLPWLGEDTCDPSKPVVLAEGPMDWLRVKSVYPNVLCGLSVGLSTWKIKRLGRCSSIITLFDVGVGGGLARKRIKEYLADVPTRHAIPPVEYGDAGAMPRAAMKIFLEDFVAV